MSTGLPRCRELHALTWLEATEPRNVDRHTPRSRGPLGTQSRMHRVRGCRWLLTLSFTELREVSWGGGRQGGTDLSVISCKCISTNTKTFKNEYEDL